MNLKNHKNASPLAQNIRKNRLANHETQEDLGAFLNVTNTTIANYESGYRQPDFATLKKMAKHYGTTIDDLIG